MKFKNLETDTIIEVEKNDSVRINKFLGYPDKFELIEEPKEEKEEKKSSKKVKEL